MNYYPKKNFIFNGIMESKDENYKYNAILCNYSLNKVIELPFGFINSTHYNDTTRLNSYSHLDTYNLNSRYEFIKNNIYKLKKDHYNSIYFELKYLYSYNID